ncbi:MAG: benzoate/H(+) symporter BenE family transporter, partial [Bosea sp. (in: a-proteobacteria)]
DPAKRWIAGMWCGVLWIMIALLTVPVLALILAMPKSLIVAVAGLGLIGSLAGALGTAMGTESQRCAAVITFAVAASGLTLFGIGPAFWGLVAGLLVLTLDHLMGRVRQS